jgi:hypothetical protein
MEMSLFIVVQQGRLAIDNIRAVMFRSINLHPGR